MLLQFIQQNIFYVMYYVLRNIYLLHYVLKNKIALLEDFISTADWLRLKFNFLYLIF